MAPPPLSDLLDWRVPYVPLLAMICVSEVSAADVLEPGLRLPRSRGLPSPDAIASDEASRPMITADVSTSVVLLLVRRNLRNMGWKSSLSVSFPLPTGPLGQGCGRVSGAYFCNGCCAGTAQRPRAKIGHAPGTPRSSCIPRLSNASPEPKTVP